jgi:hypothetical protein
METHPLRVSRSARHDAGHPTLPASGACHDHPTRTALDRPPPLGRRARQRDRRDRPRARLDLQTLVDRRKVLGLFGGLRAAALLAACGGSGDDGSAAGGTTATSTTGGRSAAGGDLSESTETAGPFPADGSNGPNVLDDSGIVRSDIRSSFGSSTTTAEGVPLTSKLTVRLPEEACEAVYATSGYEQSVANMAQVSLAGDNVFGDDGGIHQIATMSGDADSGYTAALTIGV